MLMLDITIFFFTRFSLFNPVSSLARFSIYNYWISELLISNYLDLELEVS